MQFQRSRVAIIGRPNVGKSTLFNILTGTRKAVVKDQPGVTRDIQIVNAEWCGFEYEVMDTGGLTDASDLFSKLIKEQVSKMLHTADAILVVMDGRSGLCPEDRDIFVVAQQSKKPFLIIVNKIDRDDKVAEESAEFFEFGNDLVGASLEKRRGVDEILEWIVGNLPAVKPEVANETITLAILGKPNVGKSSMVNKLLGEDRMIVSEIAGTTVDAIDSRLTFHGKEYTLIDTAGLRRKSKRDEDVEIIACFKSRDSIKKADIVLMMVDGTIGPTEQDAKIVEMILERHKGIILVANKLDLGEAEIPEFRKNFRAQCAEVFHFFPDIPVAFTSAKTGAGIKGLFEEIDHVYEKLKFRISTSNLNDFFFKVIRQAPAPVDGHKDVKFYYLTQTQQTPPSFIAFANHPGGVDNAYRRFLIKSIKKEWSLEGIPIRIFAMKARGKGEKDQGGAV